MRSPTRFDCVIVGGGPAGSTLAWLLAESEFRVLLVDAGSRPGGAPRETLLAAAGGAIERAGLSQLLPAMVDTCRHGAIWGSDQLLWREPSAGGLLLQRGTFDAELRASAQRRGVEIRTQSRVSGPLPASGAGELEILTEDGQIERVTTDRIVLATGKRTPRDLITLQEVARGPETAALCLGAECPEAAHLAIVEAVASGWWWWIGDGDRGGTATLLCDLGELTATGTRGLVERARREAHVHQPRIRAHLQKCTREWHSAQT